jgi:hypothetical protein
MTGCVENKENKEEYKHTRVEGGENSPATENGRCLDGRCFSSYGINSCSYRYQGMVAAESHLEIYNAKHIHKVNHLDKNNKRKARKIVATLSKSGVRREIDVSGQWFNIPGEQEVMGAPPTTKKGEVYKYYEDDSHVMRKNFLFVNFTIGKVPWPNQVHHVLNQSSLKDILITLKHTRKAVEQLLHKEFYNINHKDNMVILPTTEQFARITGLPKHGGHTS